MTNSIMRMLLVAFFVSSSLILVRAIEEQSALHGWVGQRPPEAGGWARLCANHSSAGWAVSNDGGVLSIRQERLPADHVPSPESLALARAIPEIRIRHDHELLTSVAVGGGWLVGLFQGEFGGGLWWVSQNLAQYRRLTAEPVVKLLTWAGRVVALAGLEHLDVNRGSVLEVRTDESGQVQLRPLVALWAFPSAAQASGDGLIVATSVGVARVSTAGRVDWLSRSDYSLVNPRSIAILKSGAIYVGMSRWVVELKPAGSRYRETWFVPNDCVRFSLDKSTLECACIGR